MDVPLREGARIIIVGKVSDRHREFLGDEHDGNGPVCGATRHHARVLGWIVPALRHGHDRELETLGGMDRHDADCRELPSRKGRGGNLGRREPDVILGCRASRTEPELGREVADVADGGEDVRLTRASDGPLALEAFEPAGVTHDLEADVGDGTATHEASGARQNLVGAVETSGHRGVMVAVHGHHAAVDVPFGGSVDRLLGARAQQDEVVRVEVEELGAEQGEETGLRVAVVCQVVQERPHDARLDGLREGRATRHDALEATCAQGVDVVVGMRGDAEEQRHVTDVLARRFIPGETVCHRDCRDGRLYL